MPDSQLPVDGPSRLPEDKPQVRVAVALVARDGRWLVARRRHGVHLGGVWEFPGGKCEPGETPAETAVRELLEECAVRATALRALEPVSWEYDDRIVHLTPVLCRWVSGTAQPLASAECRWVSLEALGHLEMPAANRALLARLATCTPDG